MFNGNINNTGGSDGGDSTGLMLSIFGIMLGYENLMENRQQSADNNVEKHNQKQAKQILDDLHDQFDRQNALLYYQNNLLEQILDILKGDEKNGL